MADEERRTAKRSRFDQTEPEVKRSSRFDRRSRSPTSKISESRRSRSPIARERVLSPGTEENKKAALDPAAAAGKLSREMLVGVCIYSPLIAAAAARINASIQAKKGIQHVDVPPIRSVSLKLQQSGTMPLLTFLL